MGSRIYSPMPIIPDSLTTCSLQLMTNPIGTGSPSCDVGTMQAAAGLLSTAGPSGLPTSEAQMRAAPLQVNVDQLAHFFSCPLLDPLR